MKTKLLALVEETVLKKDIAPFQIGDTSMCISASWKVRKNVCRCSMAW